MKYTTIGFNLIKTTTFAKNKPSHRDEFFRFDRTNKYTRLEDYPLDEKIHYEKWYLLNFVNTFDNIRIKLQVDKYNYIRNSSMILLLIPKLNIRERGFAPFCIFAKKALVFYVHLFWNCEKIHSTWTVQRSV